MVDKGFTEKRVRDGICDPHFVARSRPAQVSISAHQSISWWRTPGKPAGLLLGGRKTLRQVLRRTPLCDARRQHCCQSPLYAPAGQSDRQIFNVEPGNIRAYGPDVRLRALVRR
jgi:hypothetical protein